MKTSLPFFIAAFCLLSLSAQARLGETPAQIEARYGKPDDKPLIIRTNEYNLNYNHAGYFIMVRFWNGKSVEEDISSDGYLDDESAKNLFKTVAGKEPSKVDKHSDSDGGSTTEFKADGVSGTFATFGGRVNCSLEVEDDAYRQHVNAILDAEKKKALDSF